MFTLDNSVAYFFRALLQIPSHASIFVPAFDDNPKRSLVDNYIYPFQNSNLHVTAIAGKEGSYSFTEQAKPYGSKNKVEFVITNEVEKMKVDERFHYAFALPPFNEDGSFQWKEDVLRQWQVSKFNHSFHAPAHLMMLESMFNSVMPGGYFAAVLPKNWMGGMMKYMKWWNNNVALVARIALPSGTVGRYKLLNDEELNAELGTCDPLLPTFNATPNHTNYYNSSFSDVRRYRELPPLSTGKKDKQLPVRYYLFIWQRPAVNLAKINKLFFATKRYSVFSGKLPSLMEEHCEVIYQNFRKHDWWKLQFKFWNAVLSENLDSRYGASEYDAAIALNKPEGMRLLQVSENQRSRFTVVETVEEIKSRPLAVQLKLGPPTKVFAYDPASDAALHDLRLRAGIPQEELKRRLDPDNPKDRHRDEFTIRLKNIPFAENQEWLVKQLLDAGLDPCITRNDYNRLRYQEKWLNIQLAPHERTIKVAAADADSDETWETIYDDVSVRASFPEIWNLWESRAKKMKLHKSSYTYDFQFEDLVAMACKQCVLNGNQMGLGKTREALLLALLTCSKHTLLVVPTRLIGVWQNEIEDMVANYVRVNRRNWQGQIMKADYQVIEWGKQCLPANLRTFNIISYESLPRTPKDATFFVCPVCKFVVCSVKGLLHQPCPKCNYNRRKLTKERNAAAGLRKHKLKGGEVCDPRVSSGNLVMMNRQETQFEKMTRKEKQVKKIDKHTKEEYFETEYSDEPRKPHVGWTFATLLRNNFNMVVIEEANNVNNPKSQRAAALDQLTGRRRLSLTGTPVRGYPRSICNVLNWTFKRAVFGDYRSESSSRDEGMRKFERKYGTYIEKPSGGSQLIPKINQPELFQQEIAPLMLRRTRFDPAVAKDIPPKDAVIHTELIPMDPSHRHYYNQWLEQFAEWWKKKREEEDGVNVGNSGDLLAKIGYLINASTIPHFMLDGLDDNNEWAQLIQPYNGPLTQKFLHVQKMIKHHVELGEKTIVFCWRKASLKLGQQWCKNHKPNPYYSLIVDGTSSNKIDPETNRSPKQLLIDKFCYKDYHVLWGGIKTMKEGFNIPQASRGIFYDYTWEPADWQQGLARMLRGNAQKRIVHGTFLAHEGTIEEYISALVQLKAFSEEEGVDYREFTEFGGKMIPDFAMYANSIVDGTVKATMKQMWTDVDELRKLSEES